jgi:hypothetical protein
MERQGYDTELVKLGDQGWRATFYPSGPWHSLMSDSGTATAPTPFVAVQQAAWRALNPKPMPTPGDETVEEVL